jgi:hypothetical protein
MRRKTVWFRSQLDVFMALLIVVMVLIWIYVQYFA